MIDTIKEMIKKIRATDETIPKHTELDDLVEMYEYTTNVVKDKTTNN